MDPINKLLALAQAAGLFQTKEFAQQDPAYHKALAQASQNALAGMTQSEPMGANMLLHPLLAKLQKGGDMSQAQAFYSQTPAGRSGFGSGLAYGNHDLGKSF